MTLKVPDLRDFDQVVSPTTTRTIPITVDACQLKPASANKAQFVLNQPEGEDGRSQWYWVLLPTGDVMLACYPQGNTFVTISSEAKL